MGRVSAGALALLLAAAAARADVVVQHDGVGCVVAERHPLLLARFDPSGEVARARVLFRAAGTPHWYAVDMASTGDGWSATLPKPKTSLARLEYYVEATDRAFATVRTRQYDPEVAHGAGACRKGLEVAATGPAERLVVVAPAGAPAVPPGFLSAGLAAAGGVSAGVVAGVVAGGAAAAGAVVAASHGGGSDSGLDAPSTTTTTLPPTVAGAWVGTLPDGMSRDMNDGPGTATRCHRNDDLYLDLAQNGRDVTGTARYVSREGTNCNLEPLGTPRDFTVTGTLDGVAVSLRLFAQLPDGPSIHLLNGTLAGARMNGSVSSSFPNGGGAGTWSVRRP